MGKKKGNKAEENGDVDDVVEEGAAPASKETGKKAKKKKKDVDWEGDVAKDLEDMALDDNRETPEPEPIPEKKEKKKEKKSKKKDSDSEEEEVIVRSKRGGGFAALMDEGDDDDLSDDDMNEPIVVEKKDKKKNKKEDKKKKKDSDSEEEVIVKSKKGGGFAALMDEGDDDDLSDDDMNERVVVEKKEKKKPKKEDKPKPAVEEKNDKKKGKKGKKKKADEEDLDQILAELELEYKGEKPAEETKTTEEAPQPAEETGKKKKKKKKDVSVDEAPAVNDDTPAENKDVSADKNDAPVVKNDVSAEKIAAPAVSNEAPAVKKDAPAVKKDAPAEKIVAPAEKSDAPAEKSDAPAEKIIAPAKKVDAPAEKNDVVAEKSDAPAEIVIAPAKKVDAPAEKNDVVAVKNDAPAEKNEPTAEIEQKDTSVEREDRDEESKEKEEGTQEESSKAKKKKKKAKAQTEESKESKEGTPVPEEQGEENAEGEDGKKKKKKKKDKEAEDDDKSRKGKPSKKALAAMREILAKQKEEEERLKKEEEERIRQEEERLRQEEEEKRIEQERKERKKQKEKERKERLKAEGKLLTPKQKADLRRAQEMLEHRKAQGMVVPGVGEKRPRPGTRIRPKKQQKEDKTEESVVQEEPAKDAKVEPMEEGTPVVEEVKEEVEEVKDAWDESSDDDDEEEDTSEATKTSQDTDSKRTASDRRDAEDDDDDDDESDEEEESDSEEVAEEHMNEAEKRRQRAFARMAKRKEDNLKKLEADTLRAPVVCVLGHVDHGKTKILDKLRKTNVQEGEVGGITQQIGATNVPADAIRKQTHMVKDFDMSSLKFPGLLIIDTPGHESFRNLRSRGSSLCDIAILVVDVTQGLEPQTRESVNLLRKKGTPFIVALNKVDRVYEWNSHPSKDIREIIGLQEEHSKNDFERRTAQVIQGLREEKLNSALFFENPNPKEYISLVPTSAISGDGMGNLISLICDLCQQRLKKNLMFCEELQCTVLEVKTIQGHGTTIDVILVNGRLREGDTMILAGTEGPIVTQIRSLLLPKPLKEIRVKGQYDEFKEIAAAQGVKIAARDLEKAIAGLSLKVAYHEDEIDIIKEEIDKEFKAAMRSIKVKDRGVYVQASTLGALEALLEFFKTNDVPYSGIRVGPVVKRDVMKAAAMLEHDPMYAVILAFDVKVEKDAQDLADKEGVKIFSEETIYHLGDRYVEYLKDYKKKKQDEFRTVAVFPSRLKIIPTAIFNKRDPIVLGVTVDAGVLRTGTPLCVPAKEFVEIGIVTSMEFDHKNVDLARKGVDVCIKIEPVPGHTPKLVGRHFEPEDVLVSKISRESINACKDHFRDDLSKTDWKLMAELKKQFQIL